MSVNCHQLFARQTPLLELVIRGSDMYLAAGLLRVLVRRHIGSFNLMDLLLIMLIADASQNAMAAEYRSITEGLVLCGTLIGWNYFLDWEAFKSKLIASLLEPAPLPVVRDGRILYKNLRQEFVSDEEEARPAQTINFMDVLKRSLMAKTTPGGRRSAEKKSSTRSQGSKRKSVG